MNPPNYKSLYELIFGKSVYKKYTSQFNWWMRSGMIGGWFLFLLFYLLFTTLVIDIISNGFLYILLTPFLYKAFISLIRYTKKKIPVCQALEKNNPNTPISSLNIFFYVTNSMPLNRIIGYEKMTYDELALHRQQQLTKAIFNLSVVIILGIFTFKF